MASRLAVRLLQEKRSGHSIGRATFPGEAKWPARWPGAVRRVNDRPAIERGLLEFENSGPVDPSSAAGVCADERDGNSSLSNAKKGLTQAMSRPRGSHLPNAERAPIAFSNRGHRDARRSRRALSADIRRSARIADSGNIGAPAGMGVPPAKVRVLLTAGTGPHESVRVADSGSGSGRSPGIRTFGRARFRGVRAEIFYARVAFHQRVRGRFPAVGGASSAVRRS